MKLLSSFLVLVLSTQVAEAQVSQRFICSVNKRASCNIPPQPSITEIYRTSLPQKRAKPHRFTDLIVRVDWDDQLLAATERKHRGTLLRLYRGLEKEWSYRQRNHLPSRTERSAMLFVKRLDIKMNPHHWEFPETTLDDINETLRRIEDKLR